MRLGIINTVSAFVLGVLTTCAVLLVLDYIYVKHRIEYLEAKNDAFQICITKLNGQKINETEINTFIGRKIAEILEVKKNENKN